MTQSTAPPTLADLAKSVMDLVGQGAKLGADMLGAVSLPSRTSGTGTGCGCGCEIPEPCWMPRVLEPVTTRVCPGNTALVRINITNCGIDKRAVKVDTTGADTTIVPGSIVLDAMDQATIVVSVAIPASAPEGEVRKVGIWVRGCRDYFIRWTIEVTCNNADCCRDVAIDDCPDLVHHWYDHFYCRRGCRHRG